MSQCSDLGVARGGKTPQHFNGQTKWDMSSMWAPQLIYYIYIYYIILYIYIFVFLKFDISHMTPCAYKQFEKHQEAEERVVFSPPS